MQARLRHRNTRLRRRRCCRSESGPARHSGKPAAELGHWAGEKTEFPLILLEKLRFDQVQDLAGCVAWGRGGAVDSEVRIGRRFVGRLEAGNGERVAPLALQIGAFFIPRHAGREGTE